MPCSSAQRPIASTCSRGVHAAGRVGRRVEQQRLGARRARRLQLLDGDQVVRGLVRGDLDGDAAGKGNRLGIGGPVRGEQQHLVAGVEQGGERGVHGLLATVGDQHLARLDLVAGIARGLGGERVAQLRQSGHRGVPVVGPLSAGGDGRLDDVVGGGEVGLARAEADHRLAGRLELAGLSVDREGRGGGDPADPGGNPAGQNVIRSCRHAGILAEQEIPATPGPGRRPRVYRPVEDAIAGDRAVCTTLRYLVRVMVAPCSALGWVECGQTRGRVTDHEGV